MLKKLTYIGLFALFAFAVRPEKKITLWLIGDSTMANKEIRAYPETGWGMPFRYFFDSSVVVDNRARNGRSTRTFREEGLWQPVLDNMQEGHYVFIQFGHNDEVPGKASATTPEQFKANLERYVAETRSKKAFPILLTPVARRRFNDAGAVEGTHNAYSALVREVAKNNNVPLIDVDTKSQALLQQLGVEPSKLLFNFLQPGEHPNYPQGAQDNTHFNELGARKMAELVLADLRTISPDLANHIVKRTGPASTVGVTGKPDTSYSTYSAYVSTLKTHPETKPVNEFSFSTVAEKRNITYCSITTRDLLLDAFYPKQKTKAGRAAVLIIHGGGWRTGNRTQHYPLAQKLASLGYICFTPEYRLSTEALYPAAVYDVKAAIRWVQANAANYNIDTNKIAILGFSAGGELAAFMGATNGIKQFAGAGCTPEASGNVKAVIDIDGVLSFVHPESGEGDDSKRTSAATYWFGYGKTINPELWKQASALTWIGKHTPPTLFINSAVDRMHAGRTDYINTLAQYNTYTEVKSFAGAPHSFCLFEPWFTPTVKYIDGFLKKVFPK